MDNKIVKDLLEKMDSGYKFEDWELCDLCCEYEYEREDGYDGRWTREVTTIIKLDDRFFSIDWQEGLTEMQDDDYMNQPYEVYGQEKVITRTITEWFRKEA